MKFLLAAAFAAVLGSAALADCKCGINCPAGGNCVSCACVNDARLVKIDPLNPDGAKAVEHKPAGHYEKVCDGKSCRLMFVPDAPASVESPDSTGRAACGGRVTPFMERGPVRQFFHRFRR